MPRALHVRLQGIAAWTDAQVLDELLLIAQHSIVSDLRTLEQLAGKTAIAHFGRISLATLLTRCADLREAHRTHERTVA